MNRERLGKKIEQLHAQIDSLQIQLEELETQKDAADLAEGRAILQKKKITPEDLKFLISMSEKEKNMILSMRKESGEDAESRNGSDENEMNDHAGGPVKAAGENKTMETNPDNPASSEELSSDVTPGEE